MLFSPGDLVLLMILSQTLLSEAGSCPYYYDTQPPQTASCDPFGGFDLLIVCSGCSTYSGGFSIVWNGNDSTSEIAVSHYNSTNEKGEQVWCIESTLTLTGITLNDRLNKHYTCQIESPGSGIVFIPSSSLYLEALSSVPCLSGTTFASNEYACAVNQPTITSIATIAPTSPTSTPMIASTSSITATSAPTTVHSVSTTNSTPATTVEEGGNALTKEMLYVLSAFLSGIILLAVLAAFIMMCCCCQCHHFFRSKDGVGDKSVNSNKFNLKPDVIISSTTAKQRKFTESTQELLEEERRIIPVHSQTSEKPQQVDILRQEAPLQDTQKPYLQKPHAQNHNLQKPYEQKALPSQEQCPHPHDAFSPEQCPPYQEVNGVIPQHYYMWDHQPHKTLPINAYSNEKGQIRAYPPQDSQNKDELMQRRASLDEQLDEQLEKMSELVQQLSLKVPSPPLNSSYELITVITQKAEPSKLASQRPNDVMHSSQEMHSSGQTHHYMSPLSHKYDNSYIRPADQVGLSHKKSSEGPLPQNVFHPNSNPQLTVSDGSILYV